MSFQDSARILTPGEVKLSDGRSVDFANLDIAATAPCLRVVADAVAELLPFYGSVHRGAGALSERCTREYEQARETVADVLGHGPGDTVIFTRNTTDAFNLLARAVPAGTTVVTFDAEHHANLLPWRDTVRLAAPRSPAEAIEALRDCLSGLNRSNVLVSVTAASNVTGEVWPVARLAAVAHGFGARIAVDAAQLAPHAPGRLAGLGADYIAFSGHKLYAPFGAGVLAGRADWLDAAEPYLAGPAMRPARRISSVRSPSPPPCGPCCISIWPRPSRRCCTGSGPASRRCRTSRSCGCSRPMRNGWASCRSRWPGAIRASWR
jgi:selenocysteine lyase/cysteine desulfurase